MADSEPNIPPLPFTESDPLDGALRSVNLPVSLFLQKIKKKLLELKDTIQDRKREEENRQKILLTEGLRLGPGRLKLLDLESRSNVLPWQERYQYVRDELQRRRIPDWRNHLLTMVKDSLKIKQDQESVLFMTTLGEFESYFRSTYIVGQNLVQDLLSRLFNKQKPSTYEESINNIISALNGMKILQKKKLERVITDIQLEQIMSKCLLSSDQSEYFRE